MAKKNYQLDSLVIKLPADVSKEFDNFWRSIETVEREKSIVPIVFQDKKSGAFYIECHIKASIAKKLLDIDTALDPEEQQEYRANRDLLPLHKAFLRMIQDAKKGRQFSDIIVEYDASYKKSQPLKVLGGQHRVEAIKEAIKEEIDRPHGFKVYFSLLINQRNEISQISNTNINISGDLLDRMEETRLGPHLRSWCQKVGLLKKTGDFADRKNNEGIITVRVARTFIVNFLKGQSEKYDPEKLYSPYLCKRGLGEDIDKEYKKFIGQGKKMWANKDLINAGREFAKLHKQQIKMINSDKKLKKIKEFRNKVITPVVAVSWAYVAGLIYSDKGRRKKLFSMSSISDRDPLNVNALSTERHHSDPETYRGIGTRINSQEIGRMTEILIQYVESNKSYITNEIIRYALKKHFAKGAVKEAEKEKSKI